MKPTFNQATSSMQVIPWKDDFYLALNTYNTISFFTSNGQRILSKNLKPNSIIRYIPSGFLLFDPQNVVGQNVHFDIIKFTPVDNYDLYLRSCENSMWNEATKLQEIYNFDSDIFHKFFVQKNELNRRIIDEHLRVIKDKEFVYNFILENSSISSDIEAAMINEGLKIKPNDLKLLQTRERLRIFTNFPRTSFMQTEWNDFKRSDMRETLQKLSKNQMFKDISIIFQESTEVTEQEKIDIINHISPFIPPEEYECLMPNNVEYFKKKSFEIDEKIGQTDILCRFLKIGASRFPKELSDLYQSSLSFDEFVCNATDFGAVRKISFSDFLNMTDEEKLYIYISGCSNGLEAKEIIERHCINYNIEILSNLLSNILSDSSKIFKASSTKERIKYVAQILEMFPTKSSLAEKLINNSTILLDDQNIAAIEQSLYFLNEATKDILRLLKLNNLISKPKTYNQITPELILSIGESLLNSKYLSLSNWSIFPKSAKRFHIDLNSLTFRAMLYLKEYERIVITDNEIDICLEYCDKLIRNAKSCSLSDEYLSNTVLILGMIPADIQPQKVKKIFNRIGIYDAFSELDSTISPSIIDATQDKTNLLLNILDRKTNSQNLRENNSKAKSICKKLNDIDIIMVNDYFANKAVELNDIDFGVEFINACINESTLISYLSNENWNDSDKKVSIIDDCIKSCSPMNLGKFIECKEKYLRINDVNDANLMKFIVDTENSAACNFAKSKLTQQLPVIVSNIHDLEQFEKTVKSLEAKRLISSKERNELYFGFISKLKTSKEVYDAVNNLSENIDLTDELIDRFCCGFVSSNYGEFNFDYSAKELIGNWPELGLNFNLLISLLQQLKKRNILKKDIALDIALTSFKMKDDSLRNNAKLWSEILDEENEMILLEKTKDFGYSLASNKENVVKKATQMISSNEDLPASAIEQIIERKEVDVFVDTPRYEQIVSSIKCPKQLKNVVSCLKEIDRKDDIARLATNYFGIPDALSQNTEDVTDLVFHLLKI
ncbi:hypothetical protein TVAG_446230 [Trichomonas vaginalis G3]|uniref:Uncharacterized protein n=1 Tax=Trichomonas vaginalis (strain ATCC PRA-98 / G3) TaxID=412133 RepID=A2FG46_TRIV3|nr:hypothetical protein TVAGG3_0004120 [Trichomonas vaginalis G3]EAX96123.1 hypothetical protein TVAG_446230 [Trichomonas vaginalis G3]KAI5538798.1 hypothetical protein TVAGG3_0004120 [Trichomonas vaginalis G3]|eukprot:XP_001309053.1 hypothetical protein [Trichomonas vaginalis G3]